MVKKPRVVIIGPVMAGLTAANKLFQTGGSKELFELCVVEGENRIGGRINSSELGGDKIELGATWIHGIEGSPINMIAQENGFLESQKPWECMDGFPSNPVTIAENGHELNSFLVDPISNLFKKLRDHDQGKGFEDGVDMFKGDTGSFLRKGLEVFRNQEKSKRR